jgi:hypothetical protein
MKMLLASITFLFVDKLPSITCEANLMQILVHAYKFRIESSQQTNKHRKK